MTKTDFKHELSKDGSSTLYSNHFGQFYHNPNGAISESIQVFFESTGLLNHIRKDNVTTIFEVGFGTGLNFLLALHYYKKMNCTAPLHFYTVEAFPVSAEIAEDFNFHQELNNEELKDILPHIFGTLKKGLNSFQPIPNLPIFLHVFYGFFDEFNPKNMSADFIFQDAFSPEANPELWTDQTFSKLYNFGSDKAILATYCAATKARAAMAVAGWEIAKAPGALGKREITVAAKSIEALLDYTILNRERLIVRWENGEFKNH